jgi:pimeloyl-ACP methyl ester carboxylesterase
VLSAALAAGAVAVCAWAATVGLLWWQQDRMIFPGWGYALVQASGVEQPDERLTLTTPDGVRLAGALRRAGRQSRGLLLVFSGNAEDADWRLRHFDGWVRDLDIVTVFYRGFGPSTGVPSEAALVADATLIHDTMVARLGPRKVVAAGFSLGSGVAAQLARRRPLDGLILITAFDSIEAVAAARYPYAPVAHLLRHPFRSNEALAGLRVPVAVIGAEADRVVPPIHTRRLVEGLAMPILVRWIADADHVSIYDRAEYREAFVAALDYFFAPALRATTDAGTTGLVVESNIT